MTINMPAGAIPLCEAWPLILDPEAVRTFFERSARSEASDIKQLRDSGKQETPERLFRKILLKQDWKVFVIADLRKPETIEEIPIEWLIWCTFEHRDTNVLMYRHLKDLVVYRHVHIQSPLLHLVERLQRWQKKLPPNNPSPTSQDDAVSELYQGVHETIPQWLGRMETHFGIKEGEMSDAAASKAFANRIFPYCTKSTDPDYVLSRVRGTK